MSSNKYRELVHAIALGITATPPKVVDGEINNAKSKVTRAANKAKKAAAIASGEAFQLQKGDKILLSRNYGDAQMIASFMKVKGGTIWSAVTGGA